MPETRIADNVAWHINQEVRKIRKERRAAKTKKEPIPKPPKPKKKIDLLFEAWAKRENVDLNELGVMKL